MGVLSVVLGGVVGCAGQAVVAAGPRAAVPRPPAVYFAFDSDRLGPRGERQLRANGRWLQAHPQVVVLLEGHADAVGGAAYNVALGDRRARRVAGRLLVEGMAPQQLVGVVSFGATRPRAPGHSWRARAANRRVEFLVW